MSAFGRAHQHRFVAIVRRPYRGEPSRHFVGLPPMEAGESDDRERMALARVLVLQSGPDGITLDRYDDSGAEAGDTWHQSIDDARDQALDEYGTNLGPWVEVPDTEDDPVIFVLRLADTSA